MGGKAEWHQRGIHRSRIGYGNIIAAKALTMQSLLKVEYAGNEGTVL
jgi:hypothetical protein